VATAWVGEKKKGVGDPRNALRSGGELCVHFGILRQGGAQKKVTGGKLKDEMKKRSNKSVDGLSNIARQEKRGKGGGGEKMREG